MTRLWTEATTGKELFKRVQELPGFGKQKAQIFVALLAKQLGVRPEGWEAVAGDYALEGYRSVADVVDGDVPAQGARVQAGQEGRGEGQAGRLSHTTLRTYAPGSLLVEASPTAYGVSDES